MTVQRVAPEGAGLADLAAELMPGGASHDGRQLEPVGPFIVSANGAFKTGDDGTSYIDFACGNGSLILGHGFQPAVEAVRRAAIRGFHFSAGSEVEVRWAAIVARLMPAAQQIRFTASGNEACLLAFAVARAATANSAVLSIAGHYHGWAAPSVLPKVPLADYVPAIARGDALTLVEAPDIGEAVAALVTGRFGAVILEPTGASFGKLPIGRDAVHALAAAARSAGTICIFDETITGFRVSPAGAHGRFHVAPDLMVLGKILGGGLPCGALAGRRDLMHALDNRPTGTARTNTISHMGTGNGNPLVAAAGYETLAALADGAALTRADRACAQLRNGLNAFFASEKLAWSAYGETSGFHLFLNPAARAIDPQSFDPCAIAPAELGARNNRLVNDLRVALLAEGVDINAWPGGLTSAAHDAATVDDALGRFARAIAALRKRRDGLTGWADAS